MSIAGILKPKPIVKSKKSKKKFLPIKVYRLNNSNPTIITLPSNAFRYHIKGNRLFVFDNNNHPKTQSFSRECLNSKVIIVYKTSSCSGNQWHITPYNPERLIPSYSNRGDNSI